MFCVKRSYRDRIRRRPRRGFVLCILDGARDVLAQSGVSQRPRPTSCARTFVDSQLATLQPLQADTRRRLLLILDQNTGARSSQAIISTGILFEQRDFKPLRHQKPVLRERQTRRLWPAPGLACDSRHASRERRSFSVATQRRHTAKTARLRLPDARAV